MSKKGRTSILLLGSLVLALICIPLVFLAYGAKLDRDALNNRIAELEATETASPTALQADYRSVIESYLPILPPDSDFRCGTDRGIVVFNPANFEGWQEALEPEELDGVTVYPVTVAEDPETRYTIFYNASGEPMATLAHEQDYNPFTWLELVHPEYFDVNADPDDLAWAEAQYDPARMSVTYYLLSIDDVEAMAEAQLAADEQRAFQRDMMMDEEPPVPVTNLIFFAIQPTTNGMALGIAWGEDFTNKIEVFARSTIARTGWFLASTNLSTAGTNSLWWVDTGCSNNLTFFYSVGNADLDSDADGLTDAREWRIYGTDESSVDSDNDGLVDGYSGLVSTNAYTGGAHTNGGVYVEGELTWGTDLLLADTDDDGMVDGWEVTNGHDPLDPNDPPNVSGEIIYEGGQAGNVWVVAVTSSNSWSTNHYDLPSANSYRIANLPATNYWLKGWLDANENGVCDYPEATGFFTNNPIFVTNKIGGVDIILTDPDLDSDNLPDWWEIACFDSITICNGSDDPDGDQYTNLEEYEAGTDPLYEMEHPWNIEGTISYNGPQTGTVYVVACTSATEWAFAKHVTLATPGAYVITHLPPDRDYWIRAWRDSHEDEIPAFWEAWGEFQDNPILLNGNVAGVDVALQDADSDEDSLPDWWEVLYGFDSRNGGGKAATAWWKLDAAAGTNVQDSTSNTNHGFLVNAGSNSWTSGVISNALSLDGIDDYVQIPDSDSLKPNFVSVTLWLSPSRDYTNGSAVFFSKKQGSTGYRLSYEQGALSFLVCASGEKAIKQPINLASGVWHHVVGTYGGDAQKLYVDGLLAAETNYNWGFAFGYIDQGTTSPRIGATPGTASNLFAGLIDDVQVYAGELTSNQVWGIYETGSDEDGDGLSAWREYMIGLCPTNSDTDADGLLDGDELNLGTDPSVADTDRDGFADGADSNATSRVFIKWGDPKYTSGDYYQYAAPTWFVAAYKLNGGYLQNPPYGWSGKASGPKADMVFVPGGTNNGNISYVPPETYSLSCNPLLMDRTEVTKAKWDEIRAWGLSNGYTDLSSGAGKATNHPVQMVSWFDVVKWCNARSEMGGLQPVYYTSSNRLTVYRTGEIDLDDDCVKSSGGFRLPVRDEWEYAARGGFNSCQFPWGYQITHSQANYFSIWYYPYDVSTTRQYHPSYWINETPYTSPVGSFPANGYGLYDCAGNISEWIWNRNPSDPSKRSNRGGSWASEAEDCRVFHDEESSPMGTTWSRLGFRSLLIPYSELVIALDRQILTNSIVMEMDFLDQTNMTLYVALADTNHFFTSSNVVGNLATGSGASRHVKFDIPLESHPEATEIHIWSDRGEVTIYTNRLYVDRDHDGLDADQEDQLGTSDIPDADQDGSLDIGEANGTTAFSVSTNASPWAEFGAGSAFLTNWTGVVAGRVDSSYSPPISFPIILGAYTGSTVRVASDGYLLLDFTTSNVPSRGINLPESNLCVAPFWDDLTISSKTSVWVKTTGSGETAQLTVTWSGADTKTTGQGLDFQCVYSASNRGFVFNYRTSAGKSFPSSGFYTVGIWGKDLTPKSRIAFNQTGAQINPGMSLRLTPAVTDPADPDTDGDGATDGQEAFWGFDPTSSNAPSEDWDKDGSIFVEELNNGTDPTLPDSDLDGFVDGEDNDPLTAASPDSDTDGDGLTDWLEYAYGTSVTTKDSDLDGVGDNTEAIQGSNPADGSDGGIAPAETVDVTLVLDTYDRGNYAGAGGTALILGNICHRIPPLPETHYERTYRLPRGKAYDLTLRPVLGNVEDQLIFSSVRMEGVDSYYGWSGNRLNLGTSVIENPAQALGWWESIIFPTNHAVLKIPKIQIQSQGIPISTYIGERYDQIPLTAVVEPEMDGIISWSCFNPEMPSGTTGENITVALVSEGGITAEFRPTGAETGVSATVIFSINNHVHRWGAMGLTLPPFIRVNDNDSNHNGVPDRNETLSSSTDTNIVKVRFSFAEDDFVGACCLTNYPKPWTISLVNNAGGDKVRNIGGVNQSWIVSNAPPQNSPWDFEIEGTNVSTFMGDVGYVGFITFSNGASASIPFVTTIGKPSLDLVVHPTKQSLLLNEDDDNANGTNDYSEFGVYLDDELLEIPAVFDMEPSGVTNGTLVLHVTDGSSRVRFWADRSKSVRIQADDPKHPSEWGPSIFVEGLQKSVEPEDVGLTWAYENGIFVTQECVRLTVVQADLDMENIAEGRETGSWARNYIFYNHDDDNTNGVIDVSEQGSVAGENDLRKITLTAGPGSLVEGWFVLETQSANLCVWEGSDRSGLVALPKYWPVAGWANKTLWVEGLFPSNTPEEILTFRYTNSVSSLPDQLKLFDVNLDLILDNVQDGEEELVGGLVALNRNDDNWNGIPDYLDGGNYYDYDMGSISLLNYYGLTNGILRFEVLEGGEHVRLWETWGPGECWKEVEMPLTNVWNLASDIPPEYVSIEGICTSSAPRDVVLRLSYSNESFYAQDVVKITVIDVDIAQTNLEGFVISTNCMLFNLSADSWTNVIWTISPDLGTNGAQFSTGTVWAGTGTNAWQGTNVWVHSGSVTNLYTLTARAAELSRCCDTATFAVLKPKFVDLNWMESTNEALHNTSLYQTNALVLRRSDKFKVDLILKGYTNAYFNVWFQNIQDFDGFLTTNNVPLVPSDLSHTDWYCKLLSTVINTDQTTTIHMEINIPSTNCPIGEYRWQALVAPIADTNLVIDTTNFPGQVIILFNPWSLNDSVYIGNEYDRREYIEENTGILWRGTKELFWDFDHQSEQTLRLMLRLCREISSHERKDVIKVARCLATETRKGDSGVLFGKWGEDDGIIYAGGKKPWEWVGSAEIIEQCLSSGNTVKYGQCWVFAGLLNSFLRAAGIPSRSVTAYDAAHDENNDGFADCYFEKQPNGVWKNVAGEIWNFHLWCEVWAKRPDRINADGWQVVDATYQKGPAPVNSIKIRSGGLYDVDFVVSEVFPIRRDYIKINGAFSFLRTVTNGVCTRILTKEVGTDSSENITDHYK